MRALDLKPLTTDFINSALVKAKHYRLLNEPWQAESICKDVLKVDPDNQKAILYLILAMSDQLASGKIRARREAKKLCSLLTDPYQQKYYGGIIEERTGKGSLIRPNPRTKYIAYEYYIKAMSFYEEAQKLQTDNNQEAVLRWNACVRFINENKLEPAPEEDRIQPFLDV